MRMIEVEPVMEGFSDKIEESVKRNDANIRTSLTTMMNAMKAIYDKNKDLQAHCKENDVTVTFKIFQSEKVNMTDLRHDQVLQVAYVKKEGILGGKAFKALGPLQKALNREVIRGFTIQPRQEGDYIMLKVFEH
jgi:hypothetical protein